MKKLLQALTETFGPSGYEDEVRQIIHKEVKPFADEIRVDALGNLIVHKSPKRASKDTRRIMVAAHMDEIGMIVSYVDKNGFVHFSPLGAIIREYLPGGRIRFMNGIQGVIGFDGFESGKGLPALDKTYIDVGATSREDCPVKIGDVATFERPFTEFGDRLIAKSMGNRVGVLIAMETLRLLKPTPHELYFVFTTQNKVGIRGAATSAYEVDPDVGIALGIASAGDTPGSYQKGVALGDGPCIMIQEAGMIADPRLVRWMVKAAEKNKIPYQREVLLTGRTDARAIQMTRAGVPSGAISVPVRYMHSPSEMVDYSDVQNAVKLLSAVLYTPFDL